MTLAILGAVALLGLFALNGMGKKEAKPRQKPSPSPAPDVRTEELRITHPMGIEGGTTYLFELSLPGLERAFATESLIKERLEKADASLTVLSVMPEAPGHWPVSESDADWFVSVSTGDPFEFDPPASITRAWKVLPS